MAEHAEMANLTSGFDELPRKLEVLAGHCADVGRDMATINKTSLCTVAIAPRPWRRRSSSATASSVPEDSTGRPSTRPPRELGGARLVVGDADTAGERVQQLVGVGLDGLTFNMPANGHDPEAVAHTVGVIKAALG